MEKKRPYLSIRPQFDPGLAMVQSIIVTAVGFLAVTLLGGIFTLLLFSIIGIINHVSATSIFGFYMLVSLAGIPPVYYEIKKRALQRTLYNFYEDYIDFQYFQWYINRRRGRIWYRDIADITQHASALQEHQRLTTIYLYVPGLIAYGQRGFSGVKMEDLPQAKGYLTKVMDIVQFAATGQMPAWLAQSFPQPAFSPPPEEPASPTSPPPVEAQKTGV
jgi:hypothetical protein